MRKLLLIFFLLSFRFTYASAGSANDEIFFILVIIAVLLFIIAVLYAINFIRKIIKERKEKNTTHLNDDPDSGNIS